MYRKRLSFFRSSMRSRYPQSTSSTARSGRVASVARWFGDSITTSCAPIPFILSKRPSPSRSSSPSLPRAGNLFGTTRMLQPGVLGPPPLRPYTRISGGVRASLPTQKGQFFSSLGMTLSRRKSFGRFPRSVEIITHRPVIGSLRNSGKANLLEDVLGHPRRASDQETLNCTASGVSVKMFRSGSSHLRAERILVQPYYRRLPRAVINRHDIKPAGTFADVTFGQKSLRCTNHHVLFISGNAQFRQRGQILPDGACSNFHKRQRLAIIADEIDFAFNAARGVIPGYEHVPLPPQVPVGIGFSANAGAPGFLLFRVVGKTLLFTQAAPRRPVHRSKHQL